MRNGRPFERQHRRREAGLSISLLQWIPSVTFIINLRLEYIDHIVILFCVSAQNQCSVYPPKVRGFVFISRLNVCQTAPFTHIQEESKEHWRYCRKVVNDTDVRPPWQQSEDPTLCDTLQNPAASALKPAVKRAKASAKWHVSQFFCLEPSIPHGLSLFTTFVWKAVRRRGLRARLILLHMYTVFGGNA